MLILNLKFLTDSLVSQIPISNAGYDLACLIHFNEELTTGKTKTSRVFKETEGHGDTVD